MYSNNVTNSNTNNQPTDWNNTGMVTTITGTTITAPPFNPNYS